MKTTQAFSGLDGLTGERYSGLGLEDSVRRQLITNNSFCCLIIYTTKRLVAFAEP